MVQLKTIMLNKVSQPQNDKSHMTALIGGIYVKKDLIEVESRMMVGRAWAW